MAGVRGKIGAALRRAGDAVTAVSKVTSGLAGQAAAPDAAPKAASRAGAAKSKPAKGMAAAPGKKVAAKKAPAKSAPARKAPAKSAPGKKVPAAKKAPAKDAAQPVAKQAPATTALAKKASAAKSATAPAKKAPAAKATPAPAKKAAAKSLPAAKAATKTPVTKTSAPVAKPAPAQAAVADQPAGPDPAELTAIRARLEGDLAELRQEYEKSLNTLSELSRYQADGAGDDQADTGSKTFEREQEQSIAANRQLLLSQIEHAIERIDSGTYGICEQCGRPIPAARLKALPMATLDAECKARSERR